MWDRCVLTVSMALFLSKAGYTVLAISASVQPGLSQMWKNIAWRVRVKSCGTSVGEPQYGQVWGRVNVLPFPGRVRGRIAR